VVPTAVPAVFKTLKLKNSKLLPFYSLLARIGHPSPFLVSKGNFSLTAFGSNLDGHPFPNHVQAVSFQSHESSWDCSSGGGSSRIPRSTRILSARCRNPGGPQEKPESFFIGFHRVHSPLFLQLVGPKFIDEADPAPVLPQYRGPRPRPSSSGPDAGRVKLAAAVRKRHGVENVSVRHSGSGPRTRTGPPWKGRPWGTRARLSSSSVSALYTTTFQAPVSLEANTSRTRRTSFSFLPPVS